MAADGLLARWVDRIPGRGGGRLVTALASRSRHGTRRLCAQAVAVALAGVAITGCGSSSIGWEPTTSTTSTSSSTTEVVSDADYAREKADELGPENARRVRLQLRETYRTATPAWWPLVGRVHWERGEVVVETDIGDDKDARGPVTSMCGNLSDVLVGEEELRVVFIGDDKYGNRVKIGDCD